MERGIVWSKRYHAPFWVCPEPQNGWYPYNDIRCDCTFDFACEVFLAPNELKEWMDDYEDV